MAGHPGHHCLAQYSRLESLCSNADSTRRMVACPVTLDSVLENDCHYNDGYVQIGTSTSSLHMSLKAGIKFAQDPKQSSELPRLVVMQRTKVTL